MKKTIIIKLTLLCVAVAGLLLCLYLIDFFGADERMPAENSSYIEGATPSDIAEWEMY